MFLKDMTSTLKIKILHALRTVFKPSLCSQTRIVILMKTHSKFAWPVKMISYLSHFSQGIAGSAVLKYITPDEKRGTLGATVPGPGVTAGQAVGIEILLTFLLVFTVCASTDSKRNHYGYEVPLSIGLCVAVCHFIGVS